MFFPGHVSAWRRWPTTTFPVFIAARACMNLRNFSAILVSRVPKGPQQRVPHLDSNRHQAKQTISSTIKAGKETVPIWCILSKGASFFFLVFSITVDCWQAPWVKPTPTSTHNQCQIEYDIVCSILLQVTVFLIARYRRQRTGVSKKYQKQLWNTATVCYRLQGEQCCFPATHGNNFTLVSVIMLLHRFNNGSQSAGVNMCLVILEMSRVIERCTCCNLWLIYVSFFMYSYKVSGFEVTNDSEIIDRGNDKSNRHDGNKEHLGQKKGTDLYNCLFFTDQHPRPSHSHSRPLDHGFIKCLYEIVSWFSRSNLNVFKCNNFRARLGTAMSQHPFTSHGSCCSFIITTDSNTT